VGLAKNTDKAEGVKNKYFRSNKALQNAIEEIGKK